MFFIPKWLMPTEGSYVLFSLSVGGGYGTVVETEGAWQGVGQAFGASIPGCIFVL